MSRVLTLEERKKLRKKQKKSQNGSVNQAHVKQEDADVPEDIEVEYVAESAFDESDPLMKEFADVFKKFAPSTEDDNKLVETC